MNDSNATIPMIDTHCHIHDPEFNMDFMAEVKQAKEAQVTKLVLIGCTPHDSRLAAERALENPECYAVIGVHPHESKSYPNCAKDLKQILENLGGKVVGIGEIGLDYFYLNSDKKSQNKALTDQLRLALDRDLSISFHIRGSRENPSDAFDDAFEIFDELGMDKIHGVAHSFTAPTEIMHRILERGLKLGFNGILTFTKEPGQIEMLRAAPLESIVLETDAPFLAPKGKRGQQNSPANIPVIAHELAQIRGEGLDVFLRATYQNSLEVFRL